METVSHDRIFYYLDVGLMARKPQAPNYTPERASSILAEAEMYGDSKTCSRWGITRVTLHNYKKRLETDSELLQLLALKRRFLVQEWREDCCRSLKIGLNELAARMPEAKTELHYKGITAITGTVKVLGELRMMGEALSEDDPIAKAREALKQYEVTA